MPPRKPRNPVKSIELPLITRLVGGTSPVLPGESEEVYQQGLAATISELGAMTELQVYFAQKIFDCMWWLNRLEMQKKMAVLSKVKLLLGGQHPEPELVDCIESGRWDSRQVKHQLEVREMTINELLFEAMQLEQDYIALLDQQIANRIKAMQGLQSSFEALVNRSILATRVQLQNELMQRNLSAIEISVSK